MVIVVLLIVVLIVIVILTVIIVSGPGQVSLAMLWVRDGQSPDSNLALRKM